MLVFMQDKGPRILGPMYDISKIITRVIDGKIIEFKPREEKREHDGRETKEFVILTPETNVNPYLLEGSGESFLASYRGLGMRGQGTFVPDQCLKFFLDFPSELEEGKKNAFRVRRHRSGNGEDVVLLIWKQGEYVMGEKHDIRSPKIWLPGDNIVYWIPTLVTPFRQ